MRSESCHAKFSVLDEQNEVRFAEVEDLDERNNFRFEAAAIRGQLQGRFGSGWLEIDSVLGRKIRRSNRKTFNIKVVGNWKIYLWLKGHRNPSDEREEI